MEVKIEDATIEDATDKQHVVTVLVSGQQKETLNESNNILSKLHKQCPITNTELYLSQVERTGREWVYVKTL